MSSLVPFENDSKFVSGDMDKIGQEVEKVYLWLTCLSLRCVQKKKKKKNTALTVEKNASFSVRFDTETGSIFSDNLKEEYERAICFGWDATSRSGEDEEIIVTYSRNRDRSETLCSSAKILSDSRSFHGSCAEVKPGKTEKIKIKNASSVFFFSLKISNF